MHTPRPPIRHWLTSIVDLDILMETVPDISRTNFRELIFGNLSRELISRLEIRDQNLIIPVPEKGNGKLRSLLVGELISKKK